MKLVITMLMLYAVTLGGNAAPANTTAWPAPTERPGGYITSGFGISIQCRGSTDPRIWHFTVERLSELPCCKGRPERFLAGVMSRHVTLDGELPAVLLGESHSHDQLHFVVGLTKSTGEAAAQEFRSVIPPGFIPEPVSPGSASQLTHLATLLGTLSGEDVAPNQRLQPTGRSSARSTSGASRAAARG